MQKIHKTALVAGTMLAVLAALPGAAADVDATLAAWVPPSGVVVCLWNPFPLNSASAFCGAQEDSWATLTYDVLGKTGCVTSNLGHLTSECV